MSVFYLVAHEDAEGMEFGNRDEFTLLNEAREAAEALLAKKSPLLDGHAICIYECRLREFLS